MHFHDVCKRYIMSKIFLPFVVCSKDLGLLFESKTYICKCIRDGTISLLRHQLSAASHSRPQCLEGLKIASRQTLKYSKRERKKKEEEEAILGGFSR